MMSTEPIITQRELADLVGDLEIPCDWAGQPIHQGEGPARWLAVLEPCVCGRTGTRLICASCKTIAESTEDCATCAICREVFQPFRKIIARLEWLR